MPSSVSSRSRDAVSRTFAEQLAPLLRVHAQLRARDWPAPDVARAKRRLTAGRPTFDPATVLRSAGDLAAAFHDTAAAFDSCGIAPTSTIAALRPSRTEVTRLVTSWATSDSRPAAGTSRVARQVASLVGNAILHRVAADVRDAVPITGWSQVHCPCCGCAPDIATLSNKARTLICSRCDTPWRAPRAGCLGCGADHPPAIARVASAYLGYELAICHACGRYLKERHGGLRFQPLVERALTSGLDDAAERRGLRL